MIRLSARATVGVLVAICLIPAGCGSKDGTSPPAADTTPPAAVTTLSATAQAPDSVRLTWTAPGDDGAVGTASQYDIRYSTSAITESSWPSAIQVTGAPTPHLAGTQETFWVAGLQTNTTYHFALKSADEVPNWSALSSVVSAAIVDTVPPARVSDLVATSTDGHTTTLTWTAPGSRGSAGTAAEYDLRYALTAITADTWDAATRAEGVSAPAAAGTNESFTVRGLEPATPYFFALKTANDAPRWSGLSNVATVSTPSFWRLTRGPGTSGDASSPSWSPDGAQIAFAAKWNGNQDIYTIPAAGGAVVRMTDDPGVESTPAWSPLGDKIAFVSLRPGPTWVLQVMDAVPGSAPVTLVSQTGYPGIGKPTWSPDGVRIAYGGALAMAVNPDSICVISSSGGTPALLIAGGTEWGNWAPAWSPDGTRMAVVSSPGYTWDIWVVPLSGGPRTRVTMSPATYATFEPCWSPDGNQIAFHSKRSGNYDIYRVPAVGGALVQVTSDRGRDGEPAWSPDGSMIAFSSDRSGRSEIWIQVVQ